MATLQEARDELECFKKYFCSESIPKFAELKVSEPKSLDDIWAKNDYFPGSENGDWNAGVYIILDVAGKIIYIGKASNNNAIGHRLNTYFKTDQSDKTRWHLSAHGEQKFQKRKHPVFPVAISVIVISDYEFAWIAPALEEYLIKKLDPAANTVGKEKQTDG